MGGVQRQPFAGYAILLAHALGDRVGHFLDEAQQIGRDEYSLRAGFVLENQRLRPNVLEDPFRRLRAVTIAGHPHRFLWCDDDAGYARFPMALRLGRQPGA